MLDFLNTRLSPGYNRKYEEDAPASISSQSSINKVVSSVDSHQQSIPIKAKAMNTSGDIASPKKCDRPKKLPENVAEYKRSELINYLKDTYGTQSKKNLKYDNGKSGYHNGGNKIGLYCDGCKNFKLQCWFSAAKLRWEVSEHSNTEHYTMNEEGERLACTSYREATPSVEDKANHDLIEGAVVSPNKRVTTVEVVEDSVGKKNVPMKKRKIIKGDKNRDTSAIV